MYAQVHSFVQVNNKFLLQRKSLCPFSFWCWKSDANVAMTPLRKMSKFQTGFTLTKRKQCFSSPKDEVLELVEMIGEEVPSGVSRRESERALRWIKRAPVCKQIVRQVHLPHVGRWTPTSTLQTRTVWVGSEGFLRSGATSLNFQNLTVKRDIEGNRWSPGTETGSPQNME